LGVDDQVKYLPLELLEFTNIYRAIEKIQPDEIYNLGAQSFVALSFEEPIYTADVTARSLRSQAIGAVNQKLNFIGLFKRDVWASSINASRRPHLSRSP
jgi:GDPmannose 4,6-dehydratase